MFVCLFEVYRPTRKFFTHMVSCRWRVANFDLCSALMIIEQWGFLNMPHQLRHGPTLYNHLWSSLRTRDAHLLPSICHYLFLRLRRVATGDRTPISRMRGERSTSTPLRRKIVLVHWRIRLIYLIVFNAVLAIFQPYTGGWRLICEDNIWFYTYMYLG